MFDVYIGRGDGMVPVGRFINEYVASFYASKEVLLAGDILYIYISEF